MADAMRDTKESAVSPTSDMDLWSLASGPWGSARTAQVLRGAYRHEVGDLEGAALPRMLRLDLCRARCEDEVVYALSLGGMLGLIEEWMRLGVTAEVHEHNVLWACRRLPADYRVAKKATIDYWANTVRYERRSLSDSGYFLFYHNVEYEFWIPAARHGRYVPIPNWWREWEVPQGCWAELPPALAYVGSKVIANAESAWWAVHCTRWVISMAMYVFWDAYDTGRLWWIPPKVRSALR